MDFDDALAVLLGWIGEEVTVAVHDHSSTATVVQMTGVLGPAVGEGIALDSGWTRSQKVPSPSSVPRDL